MLTSTYYTTADGKINEDVGSPCDDWLNRWYIMTGTSWAKFRRMKCGFWRKQLEGAGRLFEYKDRGIMTSLDMINCVYFD